MKKILFVLLLSSMCVLTEADVINAAETPLANTETGMEIRNDYTYVRRVTVYVEIYGEFVEQGSVEIHKDDNGYLFVLQDYGKPIPVLNSSNRYFKYKIYMFSKWYYFNM